MNRRSMKIRDFHGLPFNSPFGVDAMNLWIIANPYDLWNFTLFMTTLCQTLSRSRIVLECIKAW